MYKKLVSENDLRAILRQECEKAGGQGRWAEQAGVTSAYVSDVLKGNRKPGDSIATALGYMKRPDIWERNAEKDSDE